MQFLRGQEVWVRRVEHMVLRVVSLAFSLASAHAIRWFFAPLDGIDALQPLITWMIAGGFGILGYIVSRGLAHRLMNKERIRAYAPICAVVEVVEIFCNYALAAAVIQRATWLQVIPSQQRALLTGLTYLVLSIIPLVSLLLAVVDMDLERSKLRGAGPVGGGIGVGNPVLHGSRGPAYVPPVMQPFRAQAQPQPKEAGYANGPVMGVPGFPAYTEGYAGTGPVMVPGAAPAASPQAQQAGGVPKQGDPEQFPFPRQASGSSVSAYDGLTLDPVTGVLMVAPAGRRLSKQEAALIRAALAQGQPVQFADRHQWRHFQVRHPSG